MASLFGFGKGKAQKKEANPPEQENKGIIGRYYEDEKPVIMKFVNELPDKETMNKLSFLTIVSWKYDGSQNNGMPNSEVNQQMITLEDAISNSMTETDIFEHAYSRTGNNLKEFAYYSTSQDDFMSLLNHTLKKHGRYPIEINFYEDREWTDFKGVLKDFSEKK
jgi:hypothetical protein